MSRGAIDPAAFVFGGRTSRRSLLKRAGLLGISLGSVGSLLAACGNGSSPATTTSGGSGGSAATSAATSAASASGTQATGAATGNVKSGGTLIVALNLEPDNLDPAVTPFAVSHTVMRNI